MSDSVDRDPLLAVAGLSVVRTGHGEQVYAVTDVSLSLARGERLGILGESGCGKSTLGEAITGLLDRRTAQVTGSVRLEGRELVGLSTRELRELRGAEVAMIFQDALSALTPVIRVGDQIAEMFIYHRGLRRAVAREQAIELLAEVGVPEPAKRSRQYPHEFSGGMRQRVLIAMAVALRPALLIADEPTTALDVTVQKQIMELLRRLNVDYQMALMLITHDLGVIAQNCERVAVMYAGRLVELAPTAEFMARPIHPYSRGLLASMPRLAQPKTPLAAIPGQPPDLRRPIVGCAFAARCPYVAEVCRTLTPPLEPISPVGEDGEGGRAVACLRWREVDG